jgi:Outer membrane protein beta-barrel domain
MMKRLLYVVMFAASFLFITNIRTKAQSPDEDGHRFEVGGQFSVLSLSTTRGSSLDTFPCLVPPCPASVVTIEYDRESEPGFGGRLGYNITNYLAVEAEVNFFPGERDFGSGREVEGLFGPKAGWRFEKAGIFGKARAGFLSGRMSDFVPKINIGCITVFPPPVGCFDEVRRRETNFALDVGGVFEIYPSKRTIIRFDAGDTIVRFSARNIKATSTSFPPGVVIGIPARTTHNLQGSVGIGVRF